MFFFFIYKFINICLHLESIHYILLPLESFFVMFYMLKAFLLVQGLVSCCIVVTVMFSIKVCTLV